jgi:hypothetical protein
MDLGLRFGLKEPSNLYLHEGGSAAFRRPIVYSTCKDSPVNGTSATVFRLMSDS